jgi:tryptophan 2,3-dioxygenase
MHQDTTEDSPSASGPESRSAVPRPNDLTPVYNERGIIAESYHDLQGLGVLRAAREAYPLPKASNESMVCAVFQSVEIALLNLTDLVTRAAADIEQGCLGPATVKMFWARGFHRVLARLSALPHQLGCVRSAIEPQGVLRISDSPAFGEYVQAINRFDRAVLQQAEAGALQLPTALAYETLDSVAFNLLHLARICNHESTIWEHNLAEVRVSALVPSYATFVVAQGMRDAVYDRVLTGDTYFTQFRGLHQIPETLGEEVNDHLEQAIRDVRSNQLPQAIAHLSDVNILSEGILIALPAIVDNLATADYHQIRENLGLTSGSHSICLRYHMFTHLYEQLWEEIVIHMTGSPKKKCSEEMIEAAIRQVDQTRFEDQHAWMIHLLLNECVQLQTFIFQWRDEHLHLPRNNLGGDFTKSLTGSPDAVKAIKHMRDAARAHDPMRPLARAQDPRHEHTKMPRGQLTQYLESSSSLDSQILTTTGHATQHRFQNVQERLGFFANRCPFSPPPKRKA